MAKKSKWYEKLFLALAAVGAVNLGLTAAGFNLVNFLLGTWPIVENVVYGVVGLCGLYALYHVWWGN